MYYNSRAVDESDHRIVISNLEQTNFLPSEKFWWCEKTLAYQERSVNALALSARCAGLAVGFGSLIAFYDTFDDFKLLSAVPVYKMDDPDCEIRYQNSVFFVSVSNTKTSEITFTVKSGYMYVVGLVVVQ